jgi:hypothetical protein
MIRLTLAALVAALSFTAAADAAVVKPRTPPVPTTTPTTPATTPGTPYTPATVASPDDCRVDMGHLRLIRPAQLEVAQYEAIFVQPVCEGEEVGVLRNEGNAGGLRPVLATKADVVEALADEDYLTDEVVGVRFGGGNTLILYVHHY